MSRQPGSGAGRATLRRGMSGPAAASQPATQPVVGSLLDERYRLLRRFESAGQRWAAVDELLDRPVEVRLLTNYGDPDDPSDAVGVPTLAAGPPPSDARWLRLLDVGSVGGLAWVVIEDPCRPSLTQRVTSTPLDSDEATSMAIGVATALERSLEHLQCGELTPERVYIDLDSTARVASVRIDGLPVGGESARSEPSEITAVRDVGRLLFCALTGRWPGRAGPGLPPATDTVSMSPRRIKGGIPRSLDNACAAACTGEIRTLRELVGRLEALPRRRERTQPAVMWRRLRWLAIRVLPPLGLVAVGLLAWGIGKDLGAIPGADVQSQTVTPLPSPQGRTSTKAMLVWTRPPAITSFDPQGDGTEDAAGVGSAVDGNPSTAWMTDLYQAPDFSGLKTGVGLLIDLKHPERVGSASVDLTVAGAGVQVRAGNKLPTEADDLPIVAASGSVGRHDQPAFTHPVKARYWLIWLTKLPAVPGGYRDGISQIRLLSPAGK